MENLNEIIFNELSKAGYFKLKEYPIWKHEHSSDFWIVVDVNDILNFDVIQKIQASYYEYVESLSPKYSGIEKNTSLLILNKVKDKNNEMVVSIENDAFFFKKYIIQYTEEELASSLDYIKECQTESIASLIFDDKLFRKLKKNLNTPVALLYTIVQKLPFIIMNVDKKDFVEDIKIVCPDVESYHLLDWVDSFPSLKGERPSEEEKTNAQNIILQLFK